MSASIQVMSFATRFTVFCPFDGAMVKFFNDIERRFWDFKFKTWSFPSTSYDRVMRYFASRGLKYESISVDAVIYKCDQEVVFKFNNWFQNMEALKQLEDIQYDKESKAFSVPLAQQDALLDVLADNGNTFLVRDIRSPEALGIAPVDCEPKLSGFKPYKRRKFVNE
jgi:hypothetical protein